MDVKYEYDRFGPWILNINEKDTVPPLFAPYLADKAAPLLGLKIPRDIERRHAHPGMNLYDYVLYCYAENLLVLERQGDTVAVNDFNYDEIESIQVTEDLLSGVVRIYTLQKNYDIRFNTASSDMITEMISLIRERYTDNVQHDEIDKIAAFNPENTMSHFFMGLISKALAKDHTNRVLVAQPEINVISHETQGFRKLKHAILGKKLLETLILTNGRELHIFSRNQFYRYRGQGIYSLKTIFMPIKKITDLIVDKDEKTTQILRVTLSASSHKFPLMIAQNNPSLMPFIEALKSQ